MKNVRSLPFPRGTNKTQHPPFKSPVRDATKTDLNELNSMLDDIVQRFGITKKELNSSNVSMEIVEDKENIENHHLGSPNDNTRKTRENNFHSPNIEDTSFSKLVHDDKLRHKTEIKEFSFALDKRVKKVIPHFAYEKDSEELTFHPKLTKATQEMTENRSSIPFIERALRWNEQKTKELEKKRVEHEKSSSENCSFKPNISSSFNNPEIAKRSSSRSGIHEKLFRESEKLTVKKEEFAKRQKEEQLKECSFKPQICADFYVQPKYMESKKKPKEQDYEIENCTFAPQINKSSSILNSHYLKSNAFERLSKPKMESCCDNSLILYENINNISSAMNTSGTSVKTSKRPKSAPSSRSCDMSTAIDNGKAFQEFLKRQNNTLKRKEQKVNFLKCALECSHQPSINQNSVELVKYRQSNFEDRLKNEQVRKDMKEKQKHYWDDKDCSFKPKINKQSQQLKGRSAEDMCRDQQIIQKRLEQKKRMIEEKEMRDAPFQPKINSTSAKSVLRVGTDPENYMNRLRSQMNKLEMKKKNIKWTSEQRELKECTFRPKIQEAPTYVKEIAKSMAVTKNIKT
ncbi:hypothetical protein ABK040_005976 [Willaertia magna]